jgi:hypothetical protein
MGQAMLRERFATVRPALGSDVHQTRAEAVMAITADDFTFTYQ